MLYFYPFPSNGDYRAINMFDGPHVSEQVSIERISFIPSSSNPAMCFKVTESADKDSSCNHTFTLPPSQYSKAVEKGAGSSHLLCYPTLPRT